MYNQVSFHDAVGHEERTDEEIAERAREVAEELRSRRSVRSFSRRPVPREALESIVWAAASAPSGANQQPWHFAVVISAEVKRQIRELAEGEEKQLYDHRAPEEWLKALRPLGTNAEKRFLEDAAALIVVFVERWAIAWIQKTFMETPFWRAAMQVVLGGGLVLAAGILIGSG